MNLILAAAYGPDRTLPETNHASLAFLGVDIVRDKRFTDISGAAFLFNMSNILIPEVSQGGQYGIRCRGTQGT